MYPLVTAAALEWASSVACANRYFHTYHTYSYVLWQIRQEEYLELS